MSRWPLHALALVLVLAGVAATSDLESSWTSDDGAYAVQAELVRDEGRWDYPNRHPEADPGGTAAPIAHSTITTDGRSYPYAKQVAWVGVLVASSSALGDVVGLHVPALAGVVLAAGAAWALALALGRRDLAPWCAWAVALGPLLVQGTALWAHTTAAAAGGVVAVLVVRVARDEARWWHHAAAAAVGAGVCLVRGEGVLLVLAGATVLAGLGLGRRPGPGGLVRAGLAAAPLALGGLVGLVGDRVATSTVVDGAVTADLDGDPGPGFLSGRVGGFLRTFVDGAGDDPTGTLLGLLAVGLAVLAGVALRRGDRTPAAVAALAAVGLVTVRTVVAGEADLAGLLVAAPLLPLGLGAWRWGAASRPERALAVLVGLVVAATVATQYAIGGGREWGGRYALTVAVPATVLALAAVADAWAARPAAGREQPAVAAVALLALAVVLPTLGGLAATRAIAADARATGDRLAALDGAPVVVTARFVPRLGWRHLPEEDWLIGRPEDLDELLARLRTTVDGPLVVVGPGAADAPAPGYHREVRSDVEVVLTPRP